MWRKSRTWNRQGLSHSFCDFPFHDHCKWRELADMDENIQYLMQLASGNGSADVEKIQNLEQTVAGIDKRIQNLEKLVAENGNAANSGPKKKQCKKSVAISQELAARLHAVKCEE